MWKQPFQSNWQVRSLFWFCFHLTYLFSKDRWLRWQELQNHSFLGAARSFQIHLNLPFDGAFLKMKVIFVKECVKWLNAKLVRIWIPLYWWTEVQYYRLFSQRTVLASQNKYAVHFIWTKLCTLTLHEYSCVGFFFIKMRFCWHLLYFLKTDSIKTIRLLVVCVLKVIDPWLFWLHNLIWLAFTCVF